MARRQVLFVDDEADFLKSVKRNLRKEPYDLITAQSGEAALEKMRAGDIDLIVSDYKMPGMDGLTLLKKIRDQGRQIPSILITAVNDAHIAAEAINSAGVVNYYLKPVHLEQLKRTMRRILHEEEAERDTRRDDPKRSEKRDFQRPMPEARTETHAWEAFYGGPVVKCPYCQEGRCFRIRRKPWMKIVPLLMRMQCRSCFKIFFRMGRG